MKTAECIEKESKLKRDNEAAIPAGPTAAHGSSPSASGSHITAGQNVNIQSYAHCTITPSSHTKKNSLFEAIQTKQSPIWGNIPPQHTQFIGRVKLLEYLHAQLDIAKESKTLIISAFKGLGGIGKTQLALEYIRTSEHYRFRVWFQAENITTLKEEYVNLAQSLSGERFDTEREAIETLKRWFKQNPGWLLVYDNVNTYDEIKALLPDGPGKIILTTRFQSWPNTFKSIEVPTMEDKEAIALILSCVEEPQKAVRAKEANELNKLVNLLGNLPLALVQAGAYIKVTKCSIAEYLKRYQENAAILLQKKAMTASEQTVALTWNISLQEIVKELSCKFSIDLICICAYLAPDSIPRILLSTWMKEALGLEEMAFDECLTGLERYSLVKTDETSISIHRVVQMVVRLQQSGKLVQKDNPIPFPVLSLEWYSKLLIAGHNEFVRKTKVLEDDLRQQALFPQLQSLKEHYETLKFIDNVAFGNVLSDIGYTVLYRKGDAKTAKIYYERALAIQQQHYGPQHVAVAITLTNLGNAYGDLGDAKQKKELLERALAIKEQHYGPQHVTVATTLANLGNAYGALGDVKKKKEFLERALAILEQHYGPQHVKVAATLTNLGNAYGDLGDAKQQKELLERALAILEQYYGSQHVEVAHTLASLGNAYGDLGDAKQQKELLERALAIQQQHYGPQHVVVARTLTNLGDAYGALGDAKKAKELLERALAIKELHYGPQHIDVAITLFNFAFAEHDLGNIQQALHLADRCYAIFLRDYGERHAYTKKAHALKQTCQKALPDAPGVLNSTTTTLLVSKVPEIVSSIPANNQRSVINNAKDSSAFCDQAPKEEVDVKQIAEQTALAVVPTKLATLLASAIANASVPVVNTEVATKSDRVNGPKQAGSNASTLGVTVLQKDFILSGAHKVITTGRVVSERIRANSSSIIAVDKDTPVEVLREIATMRNKSGK